MDKQGDRWIELRDMTKMRLTKILDTWKLDKKRAAVLLDAELFGVLTPPATPKASKPTEPEPEEPLSVDDETQPQAPASDSGGHLKLPPAAPTPTSAPAAPAAQPTEAPARVL